MGHDHSHGGHSHGGKKTDPFTLAMICLLCIFAAAAVLGNIEAVFKIAEENFNLNRWDVIMIPVGAISFTIFWWLCDYVIFAPYLLLLEDRESKTSGAEESATEALQEAEQLNAEYEAKVLDARVEAMQEKLKIIGKAKKEGRELVDTANQKAKAQIEKSRSEIGSQLEKLQSDVMTQADDLVDEIVDRVKEVPSSTEHSVH